jgi:hypothetical protein
MDVHLYFHYNPVDSTKLDKIIALLQTQQREIVNMAASIDDVTLAVQKETTVEQSAITLLQQLSTQLSSAGTDPVKLQAVLDLINNNTTALAAAVAANTPGGIPAPVKPPA